MPDPAKALETQLRNIQSKTGKTLDQLSKIVQTSGLTKHGEIRDMLKRDLSLGHGDANTLVHYVLRSDGQSAAQTKRATADDVLGEIYSGAKAGLRPIHDKVMSGIERFGPFEIAPKKAMSACAARNSSPWSVPQPRPAWKSASTSKGSKRTRGSRRCRLPACASTRWP